MRIYLDTCCYNRPFDDIAQNRVRLEADAVLSILSTRGIVIVGGSVLESEFRKMPESIKKERVTALYALASERVIIPRL